MWFVIQNSSNNKALIKKISNRRKLRRTVNQHRESDVDLELQLLYEIKQLEESEFDIVIQHVRSNQELIKLRAELSHAELMNVLADNLSTQARSFKKETCYTKLPQNNIDLIINADVINSKYSTRSKIAYQSIPLPQYYQTKFEWSHKTIENIWWKAYFNSLSQYYPSDRLNIFKFINNRLSTKARDHRYYKFKPQFCGQCQGQTEDEDHIIRCFSANRQNIRSEWLKEIETYLLKDHTPILMKHAIYDNMKMWLEPSTILTNDITYPPNILRAFHKQKAIGWRHFIRGRMFIDWGQIINDHPNNSKKKDFKAETWGANLLHINWKYIIKLWSLRCEEVHGTTSNEINIIKKGKMLEEIAHIQATNRELLLRDIEWLHEDMETLKEYDNNAHYNLGFMAPILLQK